MAIPQLSPEQLQSARAAATEARRARADLKTRIRTGHTTLSEALTLAMADESLCRMKVQDLLRSMPRVGATRSAEIMEQLGISPNRRVRGLGHHQVERLKEMFS